MFRIWGYVKSLKGDNSTFGMQTNLGHENIDVVFAT